MLARFLKDRIRSSGSSVQSRSPRVSSTGGMSDNTLHRPNPVTLRTGTTRRTEGDLDSRFDPTCCRAEPATRAAADHIIATSSITTPQHAWTALATSDRSRTQSGTARTSSNPTGVPAAAIIDWSRRESGSATGRNRWPPKRSHRSRPRLGFGCRAHAHAHHAVEGHGLLDLVGFEHPELDVNKSAEARVPRSTTPSFLEQVAEICRRTEFAFVSSKPAATITRSRSFRAIDWTDSAL